METISQIESILLSILAIAAVVERVVQFIKTVIPYNKQFPQYQGYIDIVLVGGIGALISASWGVDLFAVILPGLVFPHPLLGAAITGLLTVLPSSSLHELFELLKLWRRNAYITLF